MMKQRKQLKVSLTKILKVIELTDEFKDYEVIEDIYARLSGMLKHILTDSEIEEFAEWYLSEEAEEMGYDKDNYDNAKNILENFRKKYCKQE